MNKETQNNIVNEILDKVKKDTKNVVTDPQMLKLWEAADLSMRVDKDYMGSLKLRLTRPNREQATNEIYEKYRDAFQSWSKDDLQFIAAYLHACIAADQLKDRGEIC
jgi:ABC-type transporter MlaC component